MLPLLCSKLASWRKLNRITIFSTRAPLHDTCSELDSKSKKSSNSTFPTSKHQKTSDLEVSDDLENLSKPTLWRISKFEEVFSSTQRGTYANLKIVSQILTVPNFFTQHAGERN